MTDYSVLIKPISIAIAVAVVLGIGVKVLEGLLVKLFSKK